MKRILATVIGVGVVLGAQARPSPDRDHNDRPPPPSGRVSVSPPVAHREASHVGRGGREWRGGDEDHRRDAWGYWLRFHPLYHGPYLDFDDDWALDPYRWPQPSVVAVAPASTPAIVAPLPPPPAPGPNVDLIKISIANSNGTRSDVPLLRTNDGKFIGPGGETYDTLPSGADLARRYAK